MLSLRLIVACFTLPVALQAVREKKVPLPKPYPPSGHDKDKTFIFILQEK